MTGKNDGKNAHNGRFGGRFLSGRFVLPGKNGKNVGRTLSWFYSYISI